MMKMKTLVSSVFYLASFWVVVFRQAPHSDMTGTSTTAGAVIPTAIIENSSKPAVEERVSWMQSWKESLKRNQNACCADYFDEYDAGIILADGSIKLPASCMVEGAECPYYGVKGPAPTYLVDQTMACIDTQGKVWTSAEYDADTMNTASIRLPPCAGDDSYTSMGGYAWMTWVWIIRLFAGSQCVGIFYSATLPLKFGEEGHRMFETMSYCRRLMAVTMYWGVSGGGSLTFLVSEVYAIRWICIAPGTGETIAYTAMFALYTFMTMRPLPNRFPKKELLDSFIFALMEEYFNLRVVNECGKIVNVDDEERKKYLLAQMPHAVMPYGAILGSSVLRRELPDLWPVSGVVATALMFTPVLRHFINYLGVREAGTASILQMFADGYQAVGVVTGGIAEMFVSLETEALTCIRRGFGHIAIRGGYGIIIVFVFGVSRTHTIVPGFNSQFIKGLSRQLRLPLILFSGAFMVIPHRQQLKMVIGSPIEVEQRTEGVTGEDAQAVCDEVQDAVVDIYGRHKPFWEKRPIVFGR